MTNAANTIDVVIPTWNGSSLLDDCLTHLARQTIPATVFVVDNGSTDGTAELVAQRHSQVRVVRLPDNRGFAAAANAGIAAGVAEHVVLLNNDVHCDPAFVGRLVDPFVSQPQVGMVAALLLVPGRARIDSYGLEADRTLAAFPRFAGCPYPNTGLHERHLLGPSGGAAAYRRAALESVGGFDEAMFAYLEDADLALRLRAAGWSAAGARDAIGVHLGGASFGVRSAFQVDAAGASRGHVLRKYGVLGRGAGVAARALTVEAGVAIADALLERRLTAATARIRGWRDAADTPRVDVPEHALNRSIGFLESLRRRRAAIGGR